MSKLNKKVGLAQVGVGYWGKNLLRNFAALPDAEVLQVCDQSPEILAKLRNQYSNLDTTSSFTDILTNEDVDAVVIATQTPQHYELAKEALKAGKHGLQALKFTLFQERLPLQQMVYQFQVQT